MALRLLRLARKTNSAVLFSPLSSYHSKTLIHQQSHPAPQQATRFNVNNFLSQQQQQQQLRGYISEMRKSAFNEKIARLFRNEIQYECNRSPLSQLVPVFNSFVVDERPGEEWIRLSKKFGDEEIKVEVLMFDVAPPKEKANGIVTVDDIDLYIGIVVDISKEGKNSDVLQIECYVWPGSIEIARISMLDQDRKIGQRYTGPPFDDLDDELQKSLYDFLEARGIDDELALFLHKSMQMKCKNEYVRWMKKVESFVEMES